MRWLQRVLEQRPDVRVGDATAAANVVATAIEALTRWLVHEAPKDIDTDSIVDEMVVLFANYLRAPRDRG